MSALSHQHFADIVAALKARSAEAAPQEGRRAPRIEVSAKISLLPLSESGAGDELKALARNVSFKGVGFLAARVFERGDRFVVNLPRGKAAPIRVLCTCMHCGEVADGLFSIGAAFGQMIETDAELASALGQVFEGSASGA